MKFERKDRKKKKENENENYPHDYSAHISTDHPPQETGYATDNVTDVNNTDISSVLCIEY